LHKKFKIDFFKYVNFPIIFNGTASMPPATPLNYVPYVLVCFTFNYIIRRRHFAWWSKYNCEFSKLSNGIFFHGAGSLLDVLSAGLDAGYAIGVLIVFFVLQYPKNGTIGQSSILNWWGNTVYVNTDDYRGVPHKSLPASGKFGPSSW
jgi:hypothetical protein